MVSNRTTIIDCGASRTALGAFSRKGTRLRLDQFAVETFAATSGSEDNWLEGVRLGLH